LRIGIRHPHSEKEDLIAVVLDAAANKYQSVLTCEQRARGVGVTLLHLEEAMNQHYRQIKGAKPANDNGKELTLGAFGGICYHCKQAGQKAMECPKKADGGGGRSNYKQGGGKKKCENCGKPVSSILVFGLGIRLIFGVRIRDTIDILFECLEMGFNIESLT
jgi:hypothetical protein